MTESQGTSRIITAAKVTIALVFGLFIPVILGLILSTNISKPSNQLVPSLTATLTLASWTAGLVAEVLVEFIERSRAHEDSLAAARSRIDSISDEWHAATSFDSILVELRKNFQHLTANARTSPDLFTEYYHTRLLGICRQITRSATSQQLQVNQTHFDTTDVLLACLTGGNSDDFLGVHFLRNNGFLRDVPHAQRYLRAFEDKVKNGELKVVRRLFIVDDDYEAEELKDEFTLWYVGFHAAVEKFDYRILHASTYLGFLSDTDPDTQLAEDFGIYGPWYVYETATASIHAIQGTFNGDPDRVNIYRRHFERCWQAGRLYSDYSARSLPEAKSAKDVFDPFFRQAHLRDDLLSFPNAARMRQEKEGAAMLSFAQVTSTTANVPTMREASEALTSILDESRLCAVATVSPDGRPHINTAFFAWADAPLRLYILTPPSTRHAAYIGTTGSASVAIYETVQSWSGRKRGLQLVGKARKVSDSEVDVPLEVYEARYPEFVDILPDKSSLTGLESRFYEIVVSHCRIFDEPRFGAEVWIDVEV